MSRSRPPLKIGMIPTLSGLGGTASFQKKFAAGLKQRGIATTFDLTEPGISAVLVIAGTRHLGLLSGVKRRGIPLVQRLDGMNWLHRRKWVGVKKFCRSEINNWILAVIRRFYADRIVYQSHFSQIWWETVYGKIHTASQVTWNGVDLRTYSPVGSALPPEKEVLLQVVEGRFDAGNLSDLDNAVNLAEEIQRRVDRPVYLRVAAGIPAELQAPWKDRLNGRITFLGGVTREQIPDLDRTAHLLFSAEINAACPNAVIEALACGLPVAAYDTGSLSELVTGDSGRVVPYGADYWHLEPPQIFPLADATLEILDHQDYFRAQARRRAEQAFGLDEMVDSYLRALTS